MINIGEQDTVLFISGHTDDVELACGGTLAKCVRHGATVYYLGLTTPGNSMSIREEVTNSMGSLGVPGGNFWVLNHPDTAFPTVRQRILHDIEKKLRLFSII